MSLKFLFEIIHSRKAEPLGDIRSSCGEGDVGRLCSSVVRNRQSKDLVSIPSGVEAFLFFTEKNCSNIYWKFHLVLNDVNSESQVDRVDMVELGHHGEWYTLLIFDIIDGNDLEKFIIIFITKMLLTFYLWKMLNFELFEDILIWISRQTCVL